MNIKVTITRAENGFVAEHGGLMYVGSTPLEAMRGVTKYVSEEAMQNTAKSGDKFVIEITTKKWEKN